MVRKLLTASLLAALKIASLLIFGKANREGKLDEYIIITTREHTNTHPSFE